MILDQAVVMVTVGKMRGVPDPLIGQCDNAPEFPVVTYTYSVNYEFLNRQPSAADVQVTLPSLFIYTWSSSTATFSAGFVLEVM